MSNSIGGYIAVFFKHYFSLILLVAFNLFFFHGIPVSAESNVKIESVPGFDGAYKSLGMMPIHITITNHSDSDIEGSLALEAAQRSSVVYYTPVTVAKQTTKEVTMLVQGETVQPSDDIRLLHDGRELAKTVVGGRNIDPTTLLIGVLASDQDTANFLNLSRTVFNRPIQTVPLEEKDIFSSYAAMQGLDMIVINNYAVEQLSPEKLKALQEWTKKGGTLILSGGTHIEKLMNSFSSFLPVRITGTAELNSLSVFEEEVHKSILLQKPLTVSIGEVTQGRILYEENRVPLYVLSPYQEGNVLYIAYDLAEEPIASWTGNREIWGKVLQQVVEPITEETKYSQGNWWPLQQASERIPNLKFPKLTWLIVSFIIYLLFIGPVLYFLLKRKEKREWNWIIIPVVAVLTTIFAFQWGLMGRSRSVLTHQISFIEINQNHQARIQTVSTVFVPKHGDYQLRYKGIDSILPKNDQSYPPYQSDETWISVQKDQTDLLYQGMSHWTFQSVLVEKHVTDAGWFESDLQIIDGQLVGTVTNRTTFHLHDAKLLMGNSVRNLGTLNPGDQAEVKMAYQPNKVNRSNTVHPNYLVPSLTQNKQNLYSSREHLLADFLQQSWQRSNQILPLTVIGWTEDPVVEAELINKKQEDDHLALVRGPIQIKPSKEGEIYFPYGTFSAQFLESSVKANHVGDGYYLPAGNIRFQFNLKQEFDYEIKKIYLSIWSQDGADSINKKIYNWKTNSYVSFDNWLENKTLSGEEIEDYVSEEGEVRIELSHHSQSHHIGEPEISVEGQVIGSDSN